MNKQAFEGLKQIEATDNTVNAAFICETKEDPTFIVVVLFINKEYAGKKTFNTIEDARDFVNKWFEV